MEMFHPAEVHMEQTMASKLLAAIIIIIIVWLFMRGTCVFIRRIMLDFEIPPSSSV